MARIKKKDLVYIIKELLDVNDQINKSGTVLEGLDLAECQELAVKLGNYIEIVYKNNNKTENEQLDKNHGVKKIIHELEDYCELIYQMSLKENDDSNTIYKLTKKIKKVLINTQNDISYDLPADRKQIVFLPYKASMWDSLESIWFNARDDENVDAYVIPIPYFDRNPDGSFGEMHYEGDLYPDYVPITDWRKYSIADERPDAIFIHNPYDDCNYVTSVHPQYYSRELKKWTDCLVYVPYFVLDGKNIGEDFVVLPACFNSNYIICQTKEERTGYINWLRKNTPKSDFTEKVLPLGSPKIDKARCITESTIRVPEEWRRIIRNKKSKLVVFYNSSLGALLRSDVADYISKQKFFFNGCCSENILIIWRPHPLMETTLKAMRFDYYSMYLDLKNFFIKSNIGILDQENDAYPGMFLSDVYCGDFSSLIYVYANMKKNVYIVVENERILWKLNDVHVKIGSCKEDQFLSKAIGWNIESWEPGYNFSQIDSGGSIYKIIMNKLIKSYS